MEVELPDGGTILAEVELPPGDAGLLDERFRLDAARDMVARVASWAVTTVREHAPAKPDTFEVEFGMKLAVESGKVVAVLGRASGEASLAVRMSWNGDSLKREQP